MFLNMGMQSVKPVLLIFLLLYLGMLLYKTTYFESDLHLDHHMLIQLPEDIPFSNDIITEDRKLSESEI